MQQKEDKGISSIYIWGAGHYGEAVMKNRKKNCTNIAGFIDSNEMLWNTQKDGFTIYSPKEILQKQNVKILIAIKDMNATKEISEICNKAKIENIALAEHLLYEYLNNSISQHIELSGKRILEIGCGNGSLLKFIAVNSNPKYITGIDLKLSEWWGVGESSGTNWEVRDGNAEELSFADESFDVVISFSTFEHIHDIEKALREIKRVLKPSGRFYTEFVPIWTSAAGHHFVRSGERTWNKEHLLLIPPFGHLYMNEFQMFEYLNKQTDDEKLVSDIIQFIYHSNIINRRSRKYLMNAIMNCGMIVKQYEELFGFHRFAMFKETESSELTSDIQQKVVAAGYDAIDLGITGMKVLLEKYSDV
jgi:ubiquinone/menaquinone biosynthesis C-methylase UbiE